MCSVELPVGMKTSGKDSDSRAVPKNKTWKDHSDENVKGVEWKARHYTLVTASPEQSAVAAWPSIVRGTVG